MLETILIAIDDYFTVFNAIIHAMHSGIEFVSPLTNFVLGVFIMVVSLFVSAIFLGLMPVAIPIIVLLSNIYGIIALVVMIILYIAYKEHKRQKLN